MLYSASNIKNFSYTEILASVEENLARAGIVLPDTDNVRDTTYERAAQFFDSRTRVSFESFLYNVHANAVLDKVGFCLETDPTWPRPSKAAEYSFLCEEQFFAKRFLFAEVSDIMSPQEWWQIGLDAFEAQADKIDPAAMISNKGVVNSLRGAVSRAFIDSYRKEASKVRKAEKKAATEKKKSAEKAKAEISAYELEGAINKRLKQMRGKRGSTLYTGYIIWKTVVMTGKSAESTYAVLGISEVAARSYLSRARKDYSVFSGIPVAELRKIKMPA